MATPAFGAQASTQAEPNNAALFESRRRQTVSGSQILDNIVEGSNFNREEVDRLRKRFMKLDKDNSGTIEREEFLSLPQVSSNPLATRYVLPVGWRKP